MNESSQNTTFLKYFILKIYSFKYFYISCIFLFVTIAFFYNKYSRKVYEISTTIGPVKDNPSSALASNNLFRSLGAFSTINTDDYINSLKSFTLVSSSASKLNLEVGYFSERKSLFKQTTEVYLTSPFRVNIDKSHIQPLDAKFYVYVLNDSTFRLYASKKKTSFYNYIDNQIVNKDIVLNIDTICKFNRTITNKYFKFSVINNKEYRYTKESRKDVFYFTLFHLDELSKAYLEKLKIRPVSLMASIIQIQFSGENIEKSLDFMDKYISSFLEENLTKKNKIAISTVNFIDSQISEISDSLVISESKLRNFRSANQVMDLSYQGQRIFEQMTQIETEKANLEVQVRYYNYVINYFKTNRDMSGVAPPSSANIVDPIMNQLITELLALNGEKSTISNSNNEKNIFLVQLENKIKIKKQSIIENVTNNLNTLNLTLNELNYRYDKLSKEISNLPKTEMNMVNMKRKFSLNDAILTYLLQKRSEAAITLASNYPDFEILEPARAITSDIIKPKVKKNYLISIFLAFLIPTLFIVLKDFFNEKISSVYEIELFLKRPVLGVIYSNHQKYEAVVEKFPKSAISESFRHIRSNLFFKLKDEKSKTILITSSQPDDGKSFISFNLAASIASVGVKTVIVDCDMRLPSLHNKFNEINSLGVSTFMVNNSQMNEIIHKTTIKDLSFIPAGPVLPNPSELIDSGKLDGLINYLKSNYEYIIIDTSPIGLVSDANRLMRYASRILVISRNNFTRKDTLSNALQSLDVNKIENYDIVLNDLNLKKSPYSSYSNYYINE